MGSPLKYYLLIKSFQLAQGLSNTVNTSSPTPPDDRHITTRDVSGGILNAGNVGLIRQEIYYGVTDSPEAIRDNFADHTQQALRSARPRITGLSVIKRPEIGDIEKLLQDGISVVTIGDTGSGKSGLAHGLIGNAESRGQPHLLLDCRNFQEVQTELDLRHRFALQSLSLPRACLELRKFLNNLGSFLLVIDQLDSVVGTRAGDELVELAIDCHGRADIWVAVLSRSREVQEEQLLSELFREGFKKVQCAKLPNAASFLNALGITDHSEEVEHMARNLLNLSLIASIKEQEPNFDFSQLTNEVALWEQRLDVFMRRERVDGASLVAKLTDLAEEALKAPEGTFLVSAPPLEAHHKLLSEEFIQRQHPQSCVCSFAHENLQDFLYARRIVQNGRSVTFVLGELPRFRAQNVLFWIDRIMDRIAKTGVSDQARKTFLRELLNV